MGRLILRIVVGLLLFGSTAGAGFLGYLYVKEKKFGQELEQQLVDASRKTKLVKNKYEEEKARAGALQRAKMMLEGKIRQNAEAYKQLEDEKNAVLAEKAALSKKLQRRAGDLTQKIEMLEAKSQEYEAVADRLRGEIKELNDALSAREQDVTALETTKTTLESALKMEQNRLERCEKNNADLCEISTELIEKYKNKGVGDALLQKEPFTKVEKVRLENLMQEYLEKIEKEVLSDKG